MDRLDTPTADWSIAIVVGILLHEYMVDERALTRPGTPVVLPECDAYNRAYRQAAVFAV